MESGNFSIFRCGRNRKKAFVIGLDFIKQLNKTGGEVGKTLYSLTKQKFTFSKQITKIRYQGLDVMKLELEATHKDLGAKIHTAAFIVCQAGNITFGDEAYAVKNGSLKLIFTVCCSCVKLCKTVLLGGGGGWATPLNKLQYLHREPH